jgi:hypothetical protein
MRFYIDIETVPAQRRDVIADIRSDMKSALQEKLDEIRPPKNYGSEAAHKWMVEKGEPQIQALHDAFEQEVDREYCKTGLDGAYGQVAVIGFAINDKPPVLCFREDWEDEHGVLEDFGVCLIDMVPQSKIFDACVIGHNLVNFDLRFLTQRHIVLGIKPPAIITRAAQAKPWEGDKVFDTMVQWSGVGRSVKLDKLCKALGIPSPKNGIDGSQVWDYVRDGRISEVAEYCGNDVEATRRVHKRMSTFVIEEYAA